jgi:hypothetical protein
MKGVGGFPARVYIDGTKVAQDAASILIGQKRRKLNAELGRETKELTAMNNFIWDEDPLGPDGPYITLNLPLATHTLKFYNHLNNI